MAEDEVPISGQIREKLVEKGKELAADALEAKTPRFVEAVPAETGATAMWAGFNVFLAAGMIREAAALTTQVAGEVIPSDIPGSLAMGVRQPAGVAVWNGPYLKGVDAPVDPWGRPYVYRYPSSRPGRDFDLCSLGPNAQSAGPADQICNP